MIIFFVDLENFKIISVNVLPLSLHRIKSKLNGTANLTVKLIIVPETCILK